MKRTLVIAILSVTAFTYSYFYNFEAEGEKMFVHTKLQPFMVELTDILEKNNVEVDWSKIQTVTLLPLKDGIQGFWSRDNSTVSINFYVQLPPFESLTAQEQDDFILLILAHEVGHSQGLVHTAADVEGLMNPTSKYDLTAIRENRVEQYIVDGLKQKTSD